MSPLDPKRRRRTIIQSISLGLVVLIAGGLYYLLAARYNEEGLYENAQQLLLKGKYSEAIQVLEYLLEHHPYGEHRAQAVMDAANIYSSFLRNQSNAIPRSIELFQSLVAHKGISREKRLEARERLAEIYDQDVRDLDRALFEYQAFRQDQQDVRARQKSTFQIGTIFLKKNQLEDALREFREAARENAEPDLQEKALLKIGGICGLQGKTAEAEEVYQKALRTSTVEDTCHQARLGLIDIWESTDRFDKAIEMLVDMKGDPGFEEYKVAELKRLREKAGILKSRVELSWISGSKKKRP